MSRSAPRIFVVLPVYGNWQDAIHCLKALDSQTAREFRILIADDGSPVPPPGEIHRFQLAHYIRNCHNGFSVNCNLAAQAAIAEGATHLLFLNSDTTFGSAFMEQWIRRVSEFPDAILSPLIYWARRPGRIWTSGGKFTLLTPFARSRRCYTEVTEVNIVTGCAMLVPSAAWRTLGGLDAKYFMYFEDFDLTLRGKEAGIRTYVLPDRELHVLHRVAGSFRGETIWRRHYLMLTSRLIFIRSHYRGLLKPLSIGLSLVHLGLTIVVSLPHLPRPRPLWTAISQGFAADASRRAG